MRQPGLRISFGSGKQDISAQFPGLHSTRAFAATLTGTRPSDPVADQCAPFKFFGCDLRQRFKGTMFRFPLRSEAMAKKASPDCPLSLFVIGLRALSDVDLLARIEIR